MVADNYDARLDNVRLNAIRRAFDSGVISFDDRYEEEKYKELPLTPAGFSAQPAVSDAEIQQVHYAASLLAQLEARQSLSGAIRRSG
jgi:hypothetical protein